MAISSTVRKCRGVGYTKLYRICRTKVMDIATHGNQHRQKICTHNNITYINSRSRIQTQRLQLYAGPVCLTASAPPHLQKQAGTPTEQDGFFKPVLVEKIA
jgi:hypothetical protein